MLIDMSFGQPAKEVVSYSFAQSIRVTGLENAPCLMMSIGVHGKHMCATCFAMKPDQFLGEAKEVHAVCEEVVEGCAVCDQEARRVLRCVTRSTYLNLQRMVGFADTRPGAQTRVQLEFYQLMGPRVLVQKRMPSCRETIHGQHRQMATSCCKEGVWKFMHAPVHGDGTMVSRIAFWQRCKKRHPLKD